MPHPQGTAPESQLWTFEQATFDQLVASGINFLDPPARNGGGFHFIRNVAFNAMIGLLEGQTSSGTPLTLYDQIPTNPGALLWFMVQNEYNGIEDPDNLFLSVPGEQGNFWIGSGAAQTLAITINGDLAAGSSLNVTVQQGTPGVGLTSNSFGCFSPIRGGPRAFLNLNSHCQVSRYTTRPLMLICPAWDFLREGQ